MFKTSKTDLIHGVRNQDSSYSWQKWGGVVGNIESSRGHTYKEYSGMV